MRTPLAPVEQPPKVKTGQRVVGMRPDQGREGRHRRGVASFQLGEGFGILRGRRSIENRCGQRLERAQRLAAPAQHEIADRASLKFPGAVGDRGADADAGAEKLVGGLQPRRGVDGVAIGGVVEKTGCRRNCQPAPDRRERRCGWRRNSRPWTSSARETPGPRRRGHARRRSRASHNPPARRAH